MTTISFSPFEKMYICHMKRILLAFTIITAMASCSTEGCTDVEALNYNSEANKDDGSCESSYPLSIAIQFKHGVDQVEIYDILDLGDYQLRIEKMSFYLSHLSLNHESGSQELLDVHLFKLDDTSTHQIDLTVDKAAYQSLSFKLGLDTEMNASDPSSFESNHPLSINQNTYWQMNPASYIFVKLECKIDTDNDGSFELFQSYHLAHNDLLRQVDLDKMISYDGNDKSLQLSLDISDIMQGVNIEDQLPHHADNGDLAQLLMNNISDAFSIQ